MYSRQSRVYKAPGNESSSVDIAPPLRSGLSAIQFSSHEIHYDRCVKSVNSRLRLFEKFTATQPERGGRSQETSSFLARRHRWLRILVRIWPSSCRIAACRVSNAHCSARPMERVLSLLRAAP